MLGVVVVGDEWTGFVAGVGKKLFVGFPGPIAFGRESTINPSEPHLSRFFSRRSISLFLSCRRFLPGRRQSRRYNESHGKILSARG